MPSLYSRMRQLANKWAEMHPELEDRLQRALALTGGVRKIASSNGFEAYVVEGVGDDYIVKVDLRNHTSRCECQDFQTRRIHCKHRLATALVYETSK